MAVRPEFGRRDVVCDPPAGVPERGRDPWRTRWRQVQFGPDEVVQPPPVIAEMTRRRRRRMREAIRRVCVALLSREYVRLCHCGLWLLLKWTYMRRACLNHPERPSSRPAYIRLPPHRLRRQFVIGDAGGVVREVACMASRPTSLPVGFMRASSS